MAYDKVVDSAVLDANLTTVADAIRAKGGTTGALSFPAGFADAIAAIQAGGGSTNVLTETLTFTKKGSQDVYIPKAYPYAVYAIAMCDISELATNQRIMASSRMADDNSGLCYSDLRKTTSGAAAIGGIYTSFNANADVTVAVDNRYSGNKIAVYVSSGTHGLAQGIPYMFVYIYDE